MAAGSIVIELIAATAGFETDIGRASKIAEKRAKAIEKAFADMGSQIALAATAAGGALSAMLVMTANTAKEISNLAEVSNTSTTEFQKFAVAAKSVGIEQDKLGDIFLDASRKLGEFISTGGGETKDFFENIAPKVGVTAEALRKLSGPEALQLFYNSLEKAGLSTQEMRFYLDSLASDADKLIPVLRNNGSELRRLGSEAEAMGAVMDEKAIKAAKEFSSNLDTLLKLLNSVKINISNELIPSLNALILELNTGIKVAGGFGNALKLLGTINPFRSTQGNIEAISASIKSLEEDRARFLRFGADTSSIDTALAAERKRLEYLKEIQRLQSGPIGSPDALTRNLPSPDGGGGGGGGGGKPKADKVTEAQRLLESMQRQLQTSLQLTELEKLQADIQAKKIEGLTPAIQAQLIGLAKQIDLAKALDEFDKATLDYLKEREEFEQSIVALRKELMTDEERNADALKAQLELIGKIADAKDRGDLTRRALGKATAEAPEFAGLAPEVGGALGELAKIDEAEAKLQEWYDKQLEMLRSFREQRADLNAEFDAEEAALKAEHQAKLLQIETARSMAQLSAAESLFGNLADMTKNFAGEQSGIYRAMFAVQKAIAIAQSIVAIQQGIAMAAANPWPMNLAAMASVAAATASIISNITSTNIAGARATGGPVSADQTYLVGERGPELFTPNTSGSIVPNNKLGNGGVTVNLIEDKSRAGKTESRMNNGAQELDVFVADIMGDGPRSKAIRQAFGLQRRGY